MITKWHGLYAYTTTVNGYAFRFLYLKIEKTQCVYWPIPHRKTQIRKRNGLFFGIFEYLLIKIFAIWDKKIRMRLFMGATLKDGTQCVNGTVYALRIPV